MQKIYKLKIVLLVRVLRFELKFHAPKARVITGLYYTLINFTNNIYEAYY